MGFTGVRIPDVTPGNGGITRGGVTGGFYFCLSVNTKMIVLENGKECIKSVSEIRKGDLVLTFMVKKKYLLKPLKVKKMKVSLNFMK